MSDLYGTWDQTKGALHARQAQYQQSYTPTLS